MHLLLQHQLQYFFQRGGLREEGHVPVDHLELERRVEVAVGLEDIFCMDDSQDIVDRSLVHRKPGILVFSDVVEVLLG